MLWWRKDKPKQATDPLKLVNEKCPHLVGGYSLTGKLLVETLLPHAKNTSPFGVPELDHFAGAWAKTLSEEDRKALWGILERNPGKRLFNAECKA